jgi:quinol monooxygenase YgiN
MVELVLTFNVPAEKQAEYFKVTAEKLIPFWKSNGALSYDVWQATEGEPAFMKTVVFADMSALEKANQFVGSDAAAQSIVQLFESFVENLAVRTYIKKV